MKALNLTPRFYVAAGLVLVVLAIAFLGPLIMRTDPNATVGGLYDKPAGFGPFLLGTDNEGQSVIANLVYGTRTSLIVGLMAGVIATIVGVGIGLLAGYRGGLLDDILTAVTNVFLVIPAIVVVLLVSVAFDSRSITTIGLVIGFLSWPWLARAVRAQASSVRTREHIDVAKLSGARFFSILAWDVLPYILSYVVMAFVLQVSSAILFEATLSLLGVGPSNTTSLGIMLNWAIQTGAVRTDAWWAFLPPTFMLTIIVFALLLLQSSLDEVFNPRLRRGKTNRKKAQKLGADGPDTPVREPESVGLSPSPVGGGLIETPVTTGSAEAKR